MLEEGETGQRLASLNVFCEIADGGGGCAADALLDPDEAGMEDVVARDLGVERLDLVFAGLAFFVNVALFPSDK